MANRRQDSIHGRRSPLFRFFARHGLGPSRHKAHASTTKPAFGRAEDSCGNHEMSVDRYDARSYTHWVVRTPFCWTGRACSLTIDTMCQNPFETIRPFRARMV